MSNFINKLLGVCQAEWTYFDKSEMWLDGRNCIGKYEYADPQYKRVAEYWKSVEPKSTNDGRTHGQPWSAVFISYCMREAGAGAEFTYSDGHWVYINEAIRNRKLGNAALPTIAYRLMERPLQVGDLIGYWRGCTPITFDTALNYKKGYPSHTDIVVEVSGKRAYAIGGNVEDSVTRREVALDGGGYLIDDKKNWFVVIANNIKGGA